MRANEGSGLSHKAKHPKDRLYELHGSLLDIKCTKSFDYIDKGNTTQPLCPAFFLLWKLAISTTKAVIEAEVASQLFSRSLDVRSNIKKPDRGPAQKPIPTYERNPISSKQSSSPSLNSYTIQNATPCCGPVSSGSANH